MASNNIYHLFKQDKKQIAILIDPDKVDASSLRKLVEATTSADFYFIGGSLLNEDNIEIIILELKKITQKPIVIFPGNGFQISKKADAILLLSLISGRNPELLIGQHVQFASILKNSNLEIISTGYILVDGGKPTSVSYISNTTPIPNNKPEITAATALAGTQLGLKCIYLEAGSGAETAISEDCIKMVKTQINVPLIVGGGIKSKAQIQAAFNAGADIVVIGNALEKNIDLLK
ncbi:MAG: geranylgeranylglyceryl/heptaprenylglyceryl phosphate synthase [Bacteroidetes bacterium]|nr:geranylgeranylglyceryl/heptaprenylglyceryl phosphate synthase [Bacteroidota bacterium]